MFGILVKLHRANAVSVLDGRGAYFGVGLSRVRFSRRCKFRVFSS